MNYNILIDNALSLETDQHKVSLIEILENKNVGGGLVSDYYCESTFLLPDKETLDRLASVKSSE